MATIKPAIKTVALSAKYDFKPFPKSMPGQIDKMNYPYFIVQRREHSFP